MFEPITKDEFEGADTQSISSGVATLETSPPFAESARLVATPDSTLTYCEFCKGYYNEYHFGDIDVSDDSGL